MNRSRSSLDRLHNTNSLFVLFVPALPAWWWTGWWFSRRRRRWSPSQPHRPAATLGRGTGRRRQVSKLNVFILLYTVAEPEPPYLGRLRSRPIWSVRAEREPAPVLGFFRIAKRKSLVHAKYDIKKFFFVHNLFQSSNWQIFVFTETEPPGEPPFFAWSRSRPKKRRFRNTALYIIFIILHIYYYVMLCKANSVGRSAHGSASSLNLTGRE